jgi:Holliday junction DNA helicase RuvA
VIATIQGRLAAIEERAIVVQVGGIGFRVYVPDSFISQCGPIGGHISLYTHLHVREDELTLYGCTTEGELKLFELLLGVSGVGPRVSLALLSVLSEDEVRVAIASEQANVLARVPGIGTKTAQKIIFDLRDKIKLPGGVVLAQVKITEEDEEVIAALTSLGYSVVEAQTALQHIPASVQGIEERLRAALGYMGT